DWDVHAGQGTQDCIRDDERIRLISIHRFEHGHFWPNLPQSAVQHRFNGTINVPLDEVGMSDSDYLAIFQLVVHPIINDFKPDIILVRDPEGEMRLTPAGYATLTRQLMSWGIPLAMILEGGYFLDSIAADFEWVMRALHGDEIPTVKIEPLHPELVPVIDRVFQKHGMAYPTLALLDKIRELLKPHSIKDLDSVKEYQGTRDFPQPFPTRGLYSKRNSATEAGFSEELRKIIEGYKERNSYKTVRYDNEMGADGPFTCVVGDEHVILAISKNAEPIIHLLISQNINPLLPCVSFRPLQICPALSQVVKLLRDTRYIPRLSPLYITCL
ncbi:hypothetical protein COOONC_09238, partial [Cooperia oncophora]